mmetsp:Transcript_29034/g.33449  ORF Transcript_29034/g.33449 Transcript_29034/m.33449 type:complete len:89 (-) Transcript_29034:867-1133(-)
MQILPFASGHDGYPKPQFIPKASTVDTAEPVTTDAINEVLSLINCIKVAVDVDNTPTPGADISTCLLNCENGATSFSSFSAPTDMTDG